MSLRSPEETWLQQGFALPPRHVPAAYEAASSEVSSSSLIIRPVSFHIGLDHLVLQPPELLDLDERESRALFDAAVAWLAEEPVRLQWLTPTLWQLIEEFPDQTNFSSLHGASSRQASGRNIDAWLPTGPSARNWRRLVNDIQMLWHTHSVNEARQHRGAAVINGLWLEGQAPQSLPRTFDIVASEDPVLRGLASAANAQIFGASDPSILKGVLDDALAANQSVLVDADFWRLVHLDDGADARLEAWRRFDDWFDEFARLNAVARTPRLQLTLTGETQIKQLEPAPLARLFFWRRPDADRILADLP